MFGYSIRRVLLMIPTLLLITLVVFVVMKLAPGNPLSLNAQQGAMQQKLSPEQYQAMLHRYGLDKPIPVQYLYWLKAVATGSFGDSFIEKRPVGEILMERLPNTVLLNVLSLTLMLGIALPVGIWAAVKRGGIFDQVTGAVFYVLYSLPNFWIAILLILWLGVAWRVLPFTGMHSDGYQAWGIWQQRWDVLRHAVLPTICLTYGGLAYMSRFARANLLEVLQQDYIRTARAKGLPKAKVIFRHALRNAMIPLVTLFGFILPGLIGGSVIIEQIFAWPGLGQEFLKGVYTRDYPVIMALSFLGAVLVLISNLLADLMYAVVDPRVSYR